MTIQFREGDVVRMAANSPERTVLDVIDGDALQRPTVKLAIGMSSFWAWAGTLTLLRRPARPGDVLRRVRGGRRDEARVESVQPGAIMFDDGLGSACPEGWAHADGTAIELPKANAKPDVVTSLRSPFGDTCARCGSAIRGINSVALAGMPGAYCSQRCITEAQLARDPIGTAMLDAAGPRPRPVQIGDTLRHEDGTTHGPLTSEDMRVFLREGGAAEGWTHDDGTPIAKWPAAPSMHSRVACGRHGTSYLVGEGCPDCKALAVTRATEEARRMGDAALEEWRRHALDNGTAPDRSARLAEPATKTCPEHGASYRLGCMECLASAAPVGFVPVDSRPRHMVEVEFGPSAWSKLVARMNDDDARATVTDAQIAAGAVPGLGTSGNARSLDHYHPAEVEHVHRPSVAALSRALFETDPDVLAHVRRVEDGSVPITVTRWNQAEGRSETVRAEPKRDGFVGSHVRWDEARHARLMQIAWTRGSEGKAPEAAWWKRAEERAEKMREVMGR